VPTVLRQDGFRLYFYSNEPNEPRHIHVDKGDATIKVWLTDLEVAKSRVFRAHEISGIMNMVSEHQAMLMEKRHEYFS
jgi:hypothetical protein